MPLVVTCAPAPAGVASVAPCVDVAAQAHIPVVVDMPMPGAVHFDNAEFLFAFGFVGVLLFWALGESIGAILSLLRKD